MPISIFAAIIHSDHDMTGSGKDLCMSCHLPHNAYGDKLWFSAPNSTYSDQRSLCATCHDGVTASAGVGTVFDNNSLEQHIIIGGDCSIEDGCHDVHTQNPNVTGKFLNSAISKIDNSWCVDCHDGTAFNSAATALGDHTAGITHFTNTGFTCYQCHTPHGATAQTTNPVGLTNPILLADNQPNAYYGSFCISCHNGIPPSGGVTGSGGMAANDIFDYTEAIADGSETKHPSITTESAIPVSGCNFCHDVHDPDGTAYGYLLLEDNTNSAYCVSCHDGTNGPGVGATSHYTGLPLDVNMNDGLTPPLPWADQINEDAFPGIDWPSATTNMMVCETCHSVHRSGWKSFGSGYFLRRPNSSNNEICSICHTEN
ncbi:MAG: cytochrome c3 family protein [candidate division Zixibacteria bacterium]|nr:cytochrome c3 family protein [candidate division Zixibacteria bacterium]